MFFAEKKIYRKHVYTMGWWCLLLNYVLQMFVYMISLKCSLLCEFFAIHWRPSVVSWKAGHLY